jgi:hypothetical protein
MQTFPASAAGANGPGRSLSLTLRLPPTHASRQLDRERSTLDLRSRASERNRLAHSELVLLSKAVLSRFLRAMKLQILFHSAA